jgi:hypothetical protein
VRGPNDLEGAFQAAAGAAGALTIGAQAVFTNNRKQIVEFAAKNRLPAIYAWRKYVDDGGLMSYATKLSDLYRRAATYVDKILKGAKPEGDRGGNEICVRVTQAGQPMDLHRFWDGVITSSSNLTRLRNEATALRNRQEFQQSQLTELANSEL